MEGKTKALWDFMVAAYQADLLDESLGLIGSTLDPDTDLGDILGDFEDALTAAEFAPFEELTEDSMVPVLTALTDKDVLKGLTFLVTTLRPLVEGIMKGADGDMNVVIEMVKETGKSIRSLKPVLTTLLPIIFKLSSPALEKTFKENAGQFTGNLIQSTCTVINKINADDPQYISRLMLDIFDNVDGEEFRSASNTLVEGFLDQRPPLVSFTSALMVKRAKKRLLS